MDSESRDHRLETTVIPFKKLVLHAQLLEKDDDDYLALVVKSFQDLLNHRELISVNTTEVDINVIYQTDFSYAKPRNSLFYQLKPPPSQGISPGIQKIAMNNQKVFDTLDQILESVNDQSILAVRLEVVKEDGCRSSDGFFACQSYSLESILSKMIKFQNLTKFEFISGDTSSRPEEWIAECIIGLPNLVSLTLAASTKVERRTNSDFFQWAYDYFPDDCGKSLSSLTKLKHLSLKNLSTPNSWWHDLRWNSKLESISITLCPRFHSFRIFDFALIFKDSLKILSIGKTPYSPVDIKYLAPKVNNGKEFPVLEELTILGQLLQTEDRAGIETEESILETVYRCPRLKHLNLSGASKSDTLKIINQSIQESDSNWPSLKTLIVGPEVKLDGLDKSTKSNGKILSNGSQDHHIEEMRSLWDNDDDDLSTEFMGKLHLRNQRVIEVSRQCIPTSAHT